MKKEKIYWKNAINLLRNGNMVLQIEIDFKNEQIPVREVGFLNKYQT